jgi:hypothetical protein
MARRFLDPLSAICKNRTRLPTPAVSHVLRRSHPSTVSYRQASHRSIFTVALSPTVSFAHAPSGRVVASRRAHRARVSFVVCRRTGVCGIAANPRF